MNLCKSPFLLVSKFHDESLTVSQSGLEERGGVSRAHLHLKEHATKRLAVNTAILTG